MNAPALPIAPLVQTCDDFLDGQPDRFGISLLVATNPVVTLLDDVALPARTHHIFRRLRRLDRYDFVVFLAQWDDAPLALALS